MHRKDICLFQVHSQIRRNTSNKWVINTSNPTPRKDAHKTQLDEETTEKIILMLCSSTSLCRVLARNDIPQVSKQWWVTLPMRLESS